MVSTTTAIGAPTYKRLAILRKTDGTRFMIDLLECDDQGASFYRIFPSGKASECRTYMPFTTIDSIDFPPEGMDTLSLVKYL